MREPQHPAGEATRMAKEDKEKFVIHIDGVQFKSDRSTLSGAELKALRERTSSIRFSWRRTATIPTGRSETQTALR